MPSKEDREARRNCLNWTKHHRLLDSTVREIRAVLPIDFIVRHDGESLLVAFNAPKLVFVNFDPHYSAHLQFEDFCVCIALMAHREASRYNNLQ